MDDIKKPAGEKPSEKNEPEPLAAPEVNPVSMPKVSEPSADEDEKNRIIEESSLALSNDEVSSMKEKYSIPLDKKGKIKSRRRKMSPTFMVGAGFILLGVLAILMLSWRHESPVEETPSVDEVVSQPVITDLSARASLTEGSVQVTSDGSTYSALAESSPLNEGESIRTTDNGRVEITLEDGSVVRLDKETEVNLQSLASNRVEISLAYGEIYVRVVSSEGQEFKVTSENQSYTAAGTAFKVHNTPTSEGVQVFESGVTLTDNTTVSEGEQFLVRDADSSLAGTTTKLDKQEVDSDEFIAWNITQDLANDLFKDTLGFLTDSQAPTITITSPSGDLETKEESFTITGTINESDANLTINNTDVDLNNGGFSYSTDLAIGENKFELVATDTSGNEAKQTVTITRSKSDGTDIALQGETGTNGIELTWDLANGVESDFFRVVYGTESGPSHPASSGQTADDLGTLIPVQDGEEYFIRVCIFDQQADTCGAYSNEITVTAPN